MENIKLYFRKGSGREILFEQIGSSQDIKTQQQVSSTIHAGYYKQGGRDQQYVTPKEVLRGSQGSRAYNTDVDTGCTVGVQVIGNLYNSGGENGDVLSVEGVSKTLKSGETSTKGNGGIGSSNSPKILDDMRIRRLTPTETERLMGLEDGWTAKGIIDGKEVDISDTQRYKMCGNGVVVNCVDYIYKLLKQ